MCHPERIYYEKIGSEYLLCLAGNIREFHSFQSLKAYVHNVFPESKLVEVNDDNWSELYESGAFRP